jgi:hypothetical protein
MAVEQMAVAVLDILGFREILRTEGPQEIFDRLMSVLPGAIANAEAMSVTESGQQHRPDASAFSDTVIFYRSEVSKSGRIPAAHCIKVVAMATGEVIKWGLRQERPVLFRGAIAWGECLIDFGTINSHLGKPIVEAYDFEHAQEWVGAALAPSAAALIGDARDPKKWDAFLPWQVPFREGCKLPPVEIAINWLHNMGARDARFDRWPPPAANLCERDKKRVWLKQANTQTFYEHYRHLILDQLASSSG